MWITGRVDQMLLIFYRASGLAPLSDLWLVRSES